MKIENKKVGYVATEVKPATKKSQQHDETGSMNKLI